MLKGTLQGSNTITNPEENRKEKNEGDVEGGYANEEHLTRVPPLSVVYPVGALVFDRLVGLRALCLLRRCDTM